jgi:hypothetical protein
MMKRRPLRVTKDRTMRRPLATFVLLAVAHPHRADEPKDIVERAIQAHGGADQLARTTTNRIVFEGKGAGGTLRGDWSTQTPDRLKLRAQLDNAPGGQMAVALVLAGGKAWRKENNTAVEWDGTDAVRGLWDSMLYENHVRSLLPLLRDPKFTLKSLPEVTVSGRPAIGVEASYPDRPDVELYFDKETHLLVKTACRLKKTPWETVYDDYRSAGADEVRLLSAAGVGTDAPALRAFLAKQRLDPADVDKARTLVKRLADESFRVREQAGADLIALGVPAIGALEQAVKDEDLEVSRRARECLQTIRQRSNPATTRAALRLLVLLAPGDAAETLLALLPGADGERTEDVLAALVPLAERPGAAKAVLVTALDDKDPARREAARAVLGKDGGTYLNRPGRRLLLPDVRMAHRRMLSVSGNVHDQIELNISEVQFFNRFEDREFAKP